MKKSNEVKNNKSSYNPNSYGLTQEYNRKLYEDKKKLNEFKDKELNGKKTTIDPYSEKTIHSNRNAAQKKYGNYTNESGHKIYSTHTIDIDHKQSLKDGHDKHKKNPFLKDSDFKEIYNSDHNYVATSSNTNRSKGEKQNIDYVLSNDNSNLTNKGKVRMVKDQIVAESINNTKVAGRTLKNMGDISKHGAQEALLANAVPLVVNAANDLYLLATGDKELEDVVVDTTVNVGGVAVYGGGKELTKVALSKSEIATKLANNTTAVKTVEVVLLIKNSLARYVDGQIDEKEFVEEVGRNALKSYIATLAFVAGEALPIPIPLIGGTIASMVAVEACNLVYKIIDEYKAIDEYKKDIARFNSLAREAEKEIDKQRKLLKNMAKKYFDEFDKTTEQSFDTVFRSIITNDVNEFASGLDNLLSFFGENVMFKTYEEFDEFFMDESSMLKL